MRSLSKPIDMGKVRQVVYHSPDGQSYAVEVEFTEQFYELGPGKLCDTSEIDGMVHFYPRGSA